MSVPLDLLATATVMVVMMFVGMRFLYGAWPWEAHKTWYRTRELVEYVLALQRAHREWVAEQAGSTETSNVNLAGSPPSLRRVSDSSADSFDRSLLDDLAGQTAAEPASAVRKEGEAGIASSGDHGVQAARAVALWRRSAASRPKRRQPPAQSK